MQKDDGRLSVDKQNAIELIEEIKHSTISIPAQKMLIDCVRELTERDEQGEMRNIVFNSDTGNENEVI